MYSPTSSWLDRILGAALVLLVSAWAVSKAVHLVLGVLPALLGLGGVAVGGVLAWRWFRDRDSGW